MLNRMKSAFGGKKLAFFLGLAIAIFVSAQIAQATQVIDDALQVNSLKVGQQGVGGVTYFNGTIINETTTDGADNPVAFGDNVRIDGRVYRGATAGTSDDQPFIVNDNMEVTGSLTVGSTNIVTQLNSLDSADTSLQSQITTLGSTDDSLQGQLNAKQDAGGDIDGNGESTLQGMLLPIAHDTNGKTLTLDDAGIIQTNTGATGGGIWNLPEASTVIGATFTFVIITAQNLDINPQNGDQILGITDSSGDALRSSTIGSIVTLLAADDDSWTTYAGSGSWTDVD